jgi:hypothetical protein
MRRIPYPTAREIPPGDGAMIFHAHVMTFKLSRADNGVIFEEYEISNDTIRRLVAIDTPSLLAVFDQWAAEKRAIIERAGADVFSGPATVEAA